MRDRTRTRGFTLIELMVSVVVLAVVAGAVMQAVATSHRTQRSREMLTRVQGESRDALRRMEEDLRAASLGAPTGIVWGDTTAAAKAIDGASFLKRPAVQIFDNVPGGASFLPVKPGTDAILVVGGMRGSTDESIAPLVATRTYFDASQPLDVTEVAPLQGARFVLVGAEDAVFAPVESIVGSWGPGQVRLKVASGAIFPKGKLDPGSRVWVASTHLYYVDTQDRLMRASVVAPRAPLDESEAFDLVELADGIENLQVETQGGGEGNAGIGGSMGGTTTLLDPIVEEAKPSGLAGPTGGPVLRATKDPITGIAELRILPVMVVARSLQPVLDDQGDAPIAIGNQVALPPSTNPTAHYNRRLYRMTIGVRNTSLGAY